MPAWTNLHPVDVGNIKVGSKCVVFHDTPFEVLESTDKSVTLRCLEANPEEGYGLGVLVALTPDTRVRYDTNKQEKKQIWFCEGCKTVGVVPFKKGEGVFEVTERIGREHKRMSPNCNHSTNQIRALNGTIADLPEWARTKALALTAASPEDIYNI
jgi:hypothetical protein